MSMTTKELAKQVAAMAKYLAMSKREIDVLTEAAARLERYAAEDWRSVEEGMPAVGEWCMVYERCGYIHDEIRWKGRGWFNKFDSECFNITHYRPRPAPPKQSGGGE